MRMKREEDEERKREDEDEEKKWNEMKKKIPTVLSDGNTKSLSACQFCEIQTFLTSWMMERMCLFLSPSLFLSLLSFSRKQTVAFSLLLIPFPLSLSCFSFSLLSPFQNLQKKFSYFSTKHLLVIVSVLPPSFFLSLSFSISSSPSFLSSSPSFLSLYFFFLFLFPLDLYGNSCDRSYRV